MKNFEVPLLQRTAINAITEIKTGSVMHHWLTAAVVVSCAATSAMAGTITDTIAFKGDTDGGLRTITGAAFNPALGTLTNVSVTLTGTYDPMIYTGVPASSTQSLLDATVDLLGAGAQSPYLNSGSFTLQQSGAYLVGPAELFRFTESVDTAAALAAYTGGPGAMTYGLANLDIYSNPAVAGSWGAMSDDTSQFSGQFAITYTYAVPEPGSSLTLGAGLATFALARSGMRRRPIAR